MARADPPQRLWQLSGLAVTLERRLAVHRRVYQHLRGDMPCSAPPPLATQAEGPTEVGATNPHSSPQKLKSRWRQGTCFYYICLQWVFLTHVLQTSKKSSRSSRRLVWKSKEFLSKLGHVKEVFKRWSQGMVADGIKRSCPVIQGWGWESQAWPRVESDEGCGGQQERFLQVHKENEY